MYDIKKILILGCGYVGQRLAVACIADGLQVVATTRSKTRAAELEQQGIQAVVALSPTDLPATLLASIDAVLDSIPLTRNSEGMHASQPRWLPDMAAKLKNIRWAGYLSSTSVYGDADGAWVDESFSCHPSSARGRERLRAEKAWLNSGLPAEVFRLAGIYGPERNIIERLHGGGYKAVAWQPRHFSSRIHVDDIVAALLAAIRKPRVGRIVNLADDMPLPHVEYVTQVARIIDAPPPVILSPAEGKMQLSKTALDFFKDNKRVSNRLLHEELLAELHYPDFLKGVAAIQSSV